MTITEIRRHFIQRQRMDQMREWKATPESERPTWEQFKRGASLDHRGRSNDDCPLIVGLQNKIKELENKG